MSIFLHQWQIYQHHFKSCIIIYLSNFQSLNVRYLNNLLYYIDNSMNKDVLTSVCRFLCEYKFSTPLIVHQGIWLLDHTIRQFFFSFCFFFFFFFFFFFWETLPKWMYHFAFPPAIDESSCCSTFSPALGSVSVLDFDQFYRCDVISPFHFNLHSSNDTGYGASF